MIIKQKTHQTENTEKKIKKREEDLKLWYTHYLAHRLTGARNTNYLAYPVLSQQSLTFTYIPVAVELENIHFCYHVSIFAIFDTTPKMEGMGAEGKRQKTKIIPGTQPKAWVGWPKRLRLVQATS